MKLKVHRQHGVPLGLRHAHHQAVLRDAGVVDQDIDTAEILHDLVDHLVRILEAGGVRSIAFGLHAQRGDLGLGGLAVFVDHQIGEGYVGSFRSEFQCDSLADAAGGTRHDGYFSFQ